MSRHRSHRTALWLVAAIVVLTSFGSIQARADGRREGGHTVKVMTQNLYQGTELTHTLAAHDVPTLLAGVAADFATVKTTDFAARAGALADEIEAESPDLVGLQEVALWRTGPHTMPATPASTVAYDFLQMLLDALGARGTHYVALAVQSNFDLQAPGLLPTGITDVRLTDRGVILVRADDEERGDLTIANAQHHAFANNLVLPFLGAPTTVLAGWSSVDVSMEGETFRVIETHLGPFNPAVMALQAGEIVNGPGHTTLPLVVIGDFNSTTTTAAYAALTGAGLSDAWSLRHPGDPGFTCCQVTDAIVNPVSALTERIDYVFTRGDFRVRAAELVGANPRDRTTSGLWPSDHAGLVVTLRTH